MIHRTSRDTVEKYRELESISQSRLKLLMAGVGVYNNTEPEEKYYSEKEHFIIGSAVDTLITMGADACKEEYYVSQLENKPSATIMSIVKEVYDIISSESSYVEANADFASENIYFRDTILHVADKQEFQKRWKDETRYKKIVEQGQEYWNDLMQSEGRQILSLEQFTLIKTISDSILNHHYIEKYFQDAEHLDIFYQLPLQFMYEGISCKALLDMVIVDHHNKTIQPIDIKTMGDYATNFPISFRRRRYDIQAAFYTEAIAYDYTGWNTFKDYTILPFKFIVESTINPGTPLLYKCSKEVLDKGKYGIPAERIGKHVFRKQDGFHQAMKLYKWHLENGFEVDKHVAVNEGNLLLGLEGIVK